MHFVVFAGPSLGWPDATARGRIDFRPPAACGDIAKAVLGTDGAPPLHAIGLVDGLFETTASPWHKEIMWAMNQGVTVLGAASIGAIRAVELERHGMIGVGQVFAAYRAGDLDADDEIAVQHGPAETGYMALTEALVNIRATLHSAQQAGVIDAASKSRIVGKAKCLFFKHRTWDRILAGDAAEPALQAWLPSNVVDIKKADACALVRMLLEDDLRPKTVTQMNPTLFGSRYSPDLPRVGRTSSRPQRGPAGLPRGSALWASGARCSDARIAAGEIAIVAAGGWLKFSPVGADLATDRAFQRRPCCECVTVLVRGQQALAEFRLPWLFDAMRSRGG